MARHADDRLALVARGYQVIARRSIVASDWVCGGV